MMNRAFFVMVLVILVFVPIASFSSQLVQANKLETNMISEGIMLEDFDITAHGTVYSVREWWLDQPRVTVDYQGEERFNQEIVEVLQELGFVVGEGNRLYVKTERLQERFLYIETVYNAKEKNNMDSLLILEDNHNSQIYDFFHDAYGDFNKNLPRLILIRSNQFFQVNGDILYQGPDHAVVKTFAERLTITLEDQNYSFHVPFYPVLFLDLTQKQHLLTVQTDREQSITIDGKKITAPVRIYLDEGVHELIYADRSQYLYLKQDMEISLDEVKEAELTLSLNCSAQVRLIKDEKIVQSFEGNSKRLNLPPGVYKLVIEKEGYRRYEDTIRLSSAEQLSQDIQLIQVPGTIVHQMKLSRDYTDLFFANHKVILTKSQESILIDLKTEELVGIQSKVVWFDGNIVVNRNNITNTRLEQLWSTTELMINAVKTSNSLWLFTSDKKIISMDINRWNTQWTRTVNYLAWKIFQTGSNICILDPYSRVILINSELGYRDYFDMRVPGVKDITSVDTTKEKVRIVLQGYQGYIDYYFVSRETDIRKGEIEDKSNDFEQKGNMLYQEGKPLVSLSGKLIKVVKEQDHLAILTDEEMVVCTSY